MYNIRISHFIALNYVLLMDILEKRTRSQEFIVIRKNMIGQATTQLLYAQSPPSNSEDPQLVMYEILRSLIRKQLRRPFQLIKQVLLFSPSESSQEQQSHHLRHDLEIVAENIRNVCALVRQRLVLESFQTVKSIFMRRLRIEKTYYNVENVAKLNMAMVFMQNVQTVYLKWEGFGKLYENYKGMKLSKITLSKIEMVSNDFTAKEFEDINPFLIDRGRQIEAINSYIIDRSSQNDQEGIRLRQLDDSQELRDQVREIENQQSIEKHFFARDIATHSKVRTKEKHSSLTQKYFVSRQKSEQQGESSSGVKCSEFVADSNEKRHLKKSSTAYYDGREIRQSGEIDQNMLITRRKQADIHEAISTNRQERHSGHGQQHLFLIRDYRTKGTAPNNFIKIPVTSQNVKIVEIQTDRKKSTRKRVVKEQTEIQRQICQNCIFCQQMRERREIMKTVQQRFESFQMSSSVNEVSSK